MFEEYKLKKQLGNAGKDLDDGKFLKSLRIEVEKHMVENPIPEEIIGAENGIMYRLKTVLREKLRYFSARAFKTNLKFSRIAAYSFVLVFMGGGIAMASQESLPGDALYSVKLFTEDLRYSVSMNPEARAKLHASFAAERVSEIKEILSKKGVEPKGLDQAISRLQYNANSATEALKGQKDEAKANELAKDINETFNEQQKALKETFKKQEEDLRNNEEQIKEKIDQAKKSGDDSNVQALSNELEGVKSDRIAITSKGNETINAIGDEKEEIKNSMDETERISEDKKEISEDIAELLKEETEHLDKAKEKGVEQVQARDVFGLLDDFINKAQISLQSEKYSDAKTFLDSAKIEFEKAVTKLDNMIEQTGSEKGRSDSFEKNNFQEDHNSQTEFVHTEDDGRSSSGTFERRGGD